MLAAQRPLPGLSRVGQGYYRVAQRLKAAPGLGRTWQNPGAAWVLSEFLQGCSPYAAAGVVLLGALGPEQKVTVRLLEAASVVSHQTDAESPSASA